MSSCCPTTPGDDHGHAHKAQFDGLLYGGLAIIAVAFIVHFAGLDVSYLTPFAHALVTLMTTMWWGIALGIVAVGLMGRVPREYFMALLGPGDKVAGLWRAALAGLLLDLCSHGILMVGARLYERGASLAQLMTFLIASPWNSLSLTLILIALIGLPWTLAFIAGSVVIAFVTGFVFMLLEKKGKLPANPHTVALPADFDIKADARARLKSFRFTPRWLGLTLRDGLKESVMVMRWLFFGAILASLIRAFVPTEMLGAYFGPTIMGLFLTLLVTTIVEVCSEGSTPIGAELVTRAGAPGNGFTFLMAGVATDYTEIMVLRGLTRSWKAALLLPLVSVPQILLLGWIFNQFGG